MTHTKPSSHPFHALLAGAALAALLTAAVFAPALARAEGACPNERLRGENHSSALPDCRAYELVDPPFKYGQIAEIYAANDSTALFGSLGGFGEPGDNSGVKGASYQAVRQESSGWLSHPIEVAASEFANNYQNEDEAIADASSNLSSALLVRVPGGARTDNGAAIDTRLYLERLAAAGGVSALDEIGPMVPPADVETWSATNGQDNEIPGVEYKGASPDLSHVLFTSDRYQGHTTNADYFLWPGDTTVAFTSLYEYVGAGHSGRGSDTPSLVGVSDGTTVVDGKTIPAGQLISQCGTTLGAADPEHRSLAAYHAISAKSTTPEEGVTAEEGAKVFFTAFKGGCAGRNATGENVVGTGPLVNELFARINNRRTVSISEPTKTDCAECDTTEAENPALTQSAAAALQADYQGASADGSRVFFISRQKLFPGRGAGSNLYEYNFAGPAGDRLKLIATNLAAPPEKKEENAGVVRISSDGSRVYFVSTYHQSGHPLAGNRDGRGHTAEETPETADNLYLYDTLSGRFTFVTELAASDSKDWQEVDAGRTAVDTPDGAFLLFASANNPTPDASGAGVQLYRYDAQQGEANALAEEEGHPPAATPLIRVTIGNEGYNNNGNTPALEPPTIVTTQNDSSDRAWPGRVSITNDGSEIFFTDPLALTPQALNNQCVDSTREAPAGECPPSLGAAENVYEYKNSHVYLLSDGRDRQLGHAGESTTGLIGATPSGDNVFFASADRLVPQDTNTGSDIYDARVNGGFVVPPVAAGCAGELCQGPPPGVPAFLTPASGLASDPGNLPAAPVAASSPPKPRLSRAQQLATALHACRRTRSRHRKLCEVAARRRYGGHSSRSSDRRSR